MTEIEPEHNDKSGLGIMKTLANLETKVIHMTCSTTAHLDLFKPAPPKLISMAED